MKFIQVAIFLGLLILTSCQPDDEIVVNDSDDDIVDINEFINNIQTTAPPNANIISMEELGRLLFWDPILSGEKDVSCATCHHPDFGYADGRDLPIGVGGQGIGAARFDATPDDIGLVGRNAPTIINTAFNGMNNNGFVNPARAPMFWDNRAHGLEEQALLPILSFEEMRGHAFDESVSLDSIVNRLRAIPRYQQLFSQGFNQNNSINSDNIASAIAAFERTITATNSSFDRFQAGDENAMTENAKRGMDRFREVGCIQCHSGPMFSDFELHTLGIPDNPLRSTTDAGAEGTYAFRTPTLRNLNETGPYFHNGVGGDLQEVLRFYRVASGPGPSGPGSPTPAGLNINENVSPNDIDQKVKDLRPINNNDIQSIIAFIQALNDPDFDRRIPTQVPSGLNPGGNIN